MPYAPKWGQQEREGERDCDDLVGSKRVIDDIVINKTIAS
jgi:hypothetical protein